MQQRERCTIGAGRCIPHCPGWRDTSRGSLSRGDVLSVSSPHRLVRTSVCFPMLCLPEIGAMWLLTLCGCFSQETTVSAVGARDACRRHAEWENFTRVAIFRR